MMINSLYGVFNNFAFMEQAMQMSIRVFLC